MPKKPRSINAIGRKRRTLGFTLLTLGLLVAGVWVASGWWRLEVSVGGVETSADSGLLFITTTTSGVRQPARSLVSRSDIGGWNWRIPDGLRLADFRVFAPTVKGFDLMVADYIVLRDYRGMRTALWPIPLLLCTPAALLLRSGILARRRALTGKCKKCGYDLAGLGDGAKCPECGKAEVAA